MSIGSVHHRLLIEWDHPILTGPVLLGSLVRLLFILIVVIIVFVIELTRRMPTV